MNATTTTNARKYPYPADAIRAAVLDCIPRSYRDDPIRGACRVLGINPPADGSPIPDAVVLIAEGSRGDLLSFVACADCFAEQGDDDMANRCYGTVRAILRAALRSPEGKRYLARRGRARAGNPLRQYETDMSLSTRDCSAEEASRQFVNDYLRHGQA
jgi:hypothetical protein